MAAPLTNMQRAILLDRYARKDLSRESLAPGDVVLAILDNTSARREVARVVAVNRDANTAHVAVEGYFYEVMIDALDKPIETTPEEIQERVAIAVACAEKPEIQSYWIERFSHAMENFKFVPGGRIMAGAGIEANLTSINCFVLPLPHDSRGGILKTAGDMAEIMSRGGGVGINISSLRPRNAFVQGVNGRSSGAVSWGGLYSYITGLITQAGSRRGALMLCIHDWHPDVIEFIGSKMQSGKITNANISVFVSDAFMRAVDEDGDWTLEFPDTKHPQYDAEWNGDLHSWKIAGRPTIHYQTIKARDLWNRVVDSAWSSAEPGLLFYDRIQKYSNSYYYNKLVGSNPCQPELATVLTPNGISTIGKIQVGDTIWSGKRWTTVIRKQSTGVKSVFEFVTNAGVFVGTEEHSVFQNEQRVEAKNADSIDVCVGECAITESFDAQIIMDGLMIGDGGVHKASNNLPILYIGSNDSEYHTSEVASLLKRYRPGISDETWEVETTLAASDLSHTYNRIVPERYFYGNTHTVLSFLRGLFSANGSVVGGQTGCRVTLKASSERLVRQVQMMLSSVGIRSRITINKPQSIDFSNGTYLCRQSYDLNIGPDRFKFAKLIGFVQAYKNAKIIGGTGNGKSSYDVISVNNVGELPVFDITVEADEHSYWTGGLLVSNCGEQLLPAYGVCNLGSINLSQFYNATAHDVNWQELQETVRIAVRFLDDVLDVTYYPMPEIAEQQRRERRVGLGTMGLAELLIKLHVRYGSEEALHLVDQIYGFIAEEAYQASVDFAIEKGSFLEFKAEPFVASGFMKEMPDYIRDRVMEYGIRNVTLLTAQPTGTTSTLAGTSNGIEPYFAFQWQRHSRIGDFEENIPIAQDWIRAHAGQELPAWFVTAQQLSPDEHVAMQAAVQRWNDSATSKTCNLPSHYSRQDVDRIYHAMYDQGCKGGTIYRDGSRDEQVLEVVKSGEECPECHTKTYYNQGGCWTCSTCGFSKCNI